MICRRVIDLISRPATWTRHRYLRAGTKRPAPLVGDAGATVRAVPRRAAGRPARSDADGGGRRELEDTGAQRAGLLVDHGAARTRELPAAQIVLAHRHVVADRA